MIKPNLAKESIKQNQCLLSLAGYSIAKPSKTEPIVFDTREPNTGCCYVFVTKVCMSNSFSLLSLDINMTPDRWPRKQELGYNYIPWTSDINNYSLKDILLSAHPNRARAWQMATELLLGNIFDIRFFDILKEHAKHGTKEFRQLPNKERHTEIQKLHKLYTKIDHDK